MRTRVHQDLVYRRCKWQLWLLSPVVLRWVVLGDVVLCRVTLL